MKKAITILAAILGISCSANSDGVSNFELDYDQLIFLDAENLAELGVLQAYEDLKPILSGYVPQPALVEEIIDANLPSYHISSQGKKFEIFSPENEEQSWEKAAFAFFSVINLQLEHTDTRFYAINGGHDLGGMFLTKDQYKAAINSLPNKSDWPYIPKLEHPWYGQPH